MSTLVSSLPTVNIHQPLDEGQTVDGACKEQFASTLTDQPEALQCTYSGCYITGVYKVMEFQFGYTIEDTAKVIGAIYKSLNWYYIIRRPHYFIPPLTYIL